MIARRRRDRLFARALALSLLFHLSAVTLFRIVFSFPHKDIEYFNVAIVETPAPGPGLAGEKLSVAGPDFSAAPATDPPLPDIQLPALKFDRLSMLRMRQEALETRSRFDELFAGATDEPWTHAASSFSALGQTLSRLTFGTPDPATPAPAPVSRPAPGFEAYIEWTSEPHDRKVVAVVPIDKLWGLSPSALPEPITLKFNVNRKGKVVGRILIFSPLHDPKGYADASGQALKRYRFEPLLGDGPPTQSGTLIVRAAASDTP
jgi:hypothetical protein